MFHFLYLFFFLQSKLCSLRNASAKELISHKEEATEMGG
jgi:hypothetical protein